MSELVWKEIYQLQKTVEFLRKDQKKQTKINSELWECMHQANKQRGNK